MNNQTIIQKIANRRKIILSIDLDNTLVNRSLGSNYIKPETLEILKKLDKNKFTIMPNTGRDLVGTRSFFYDTIKLNDAIMGSGSVIMAEGKVYFNSASEFLSDITEDTIKAVENGITPFIDIYYDKGRIIFYNEEQKETYQDLFYQQNPQDWFNGELPPSFPVSLVKDKLPTNIFRIEFPVLKKYKELYESLINKNNKAMEEWLKIIKSDVKYEEYSIKRKKFFCQNFQQELTFARLEKREGIVNKGIGLEQWLEIKKIDIANTSIVHIGDQDQGLINDTVIKQNIPQAIIIMVGNKCSLNNTEVDLYLPGDVDVNLFELFSRLTNL